MRFFTTQIRPGQPPVLVQEGFSGAAFWFGAFWLAARGGWIAAGLVFAASCLLAALVRITHEPALILCFALLQGLVCPDLLRWNLAQRGYRPGPPVAARDAELALQRLLDHRPDIVRLAEGVPG